MNFRSLAATILCLLLLQAPRVWSAPFLAELTAQLAARKTEIEKDRKALNTDCERVPSSLTAKVANCQQHRDEVARRIEQYKKDFRNLETIREAVAGERDFFYAVPRDEIRIPLGILMLAHKLRWPEEKRARLEKSLKELEPDTPPSTTEEQIRDSWKAIMASNSNAELAKAAGPRQINSVGQQTKMDCTIAAIATASGQPYDKVAERAMDLIRRGPWRHDAEREEPQEVIRRGLNGGEVVLLAESLGKAEIVPSKRFEKTLKDGRPVMINVATVSPPPSFPWQPTARIAGHQVVLTKTFRHKGQTWYEISNPSDPGNRYFTTLDKLAPILQEKGIVIDRER